MDETMLKLLESISLRLDTIEKKVDRNHDVSLGGIQKHEEDITLLNEKLDDTLLILLKRNGHINLKDLIDITKPY